MSARPPLPEGLVAFVKREAQLLGLTPFFGERIYGALDDYQNFSKKTIVEKILRELPDRRRIAEELVRVEVRPAVIAVSVLKVPTEHEHLGVAELLKRVRADFFQSSHCFLSRGAPPPRPATPRSRSAR